MTDDNRLSDAVADLNDKHLTCRDLGHSWARGTHMTIESPDGASVLERALWCRVCETVRKEVIDRRTGELVKRSYTYKEGYRFPKGVAGRGGLPKFHFRSEWIKRLENA